MKVINKDILSVTEGMIVHQVNCMGVMGAGLALDIKRKWRKVFYQYKQYVENCSGAELGDVQFVQITDSIYVCNLFSQKYYGKDKGMLYTNYEAMEKGFKTINERSKELKLPIYIPFKIGCGLGNGDWTKVYSLISKYIPNSTICRK